MPCSHLLALESGALCAKMALWREIMAQPHRHWGWTLRTHHVANRRFPTAFRLLRAHAVAWCRIAFNVSMETRWGEHVRVVGSHEKLGCWDPRKGIPLETSEETYPTWSGSVELDLQGFNYKFVVVAPCGAVTWEPGEDRSFLFFQPSAMPVELLSPAPKPQPRMCPPRVVPPGT